MGATASITPGGDGRYGVYHSLGTRIDNNKRRGWAPRRPSLREGMGVTVSITPWEPQEYGRDFVGTSLTIHNQALGLFRILFPSSRLRPTQRLQ